MSRAALRMRGDGPASGRTSPVILTCLTATSEESRNHRNPAISRASRARAQTAARGRRGTLRTRGMAAARCIRWGSTRRRGLPARGCRVRWTPDSGGGPRAADSGDERAAERIDVAGAQHEHEVAGAQPGPRTALGLVEVGSQKTVARRPRPPRPAISWPSTPGKSSARSRAG